MPTFPPTPPGIPRVLNPLNPRHYWLLFTWIYFRPSHIKHYLYQANPELYTATGRAIFSTWRFSAYRNLYAISLALTITLSIGVAWAMSVAQRTPIEWGDLVLGVAVGVVGSVVFSLVFGMASGMASGVASGVVVSVASGVAVSMVGGVADSVMGGIVFSVVYGIAAGVLGNMMFGIAGGVVVGVTVGVVGGVAFGLRFDVAVSVILGVAGSVGGSRLIFHLCEWPWAWWLSLSVSNPFTRLKHHPSMWDELAMWPLPGITRLLCACLSTDLNRGLLLAAQIVANPFQRWAVQRALSDFIEEHPESLGLLYHLAQWPALETYLTLPLAERDFEAFRSTRQVLLGEIGQVYVGSIAAVIQDFIERLIWRFTRKQRRMTHTPISVFSKFLWLLGYADTIYSRLGKLELNIGLPLNFSFEIADIKKEHFSNLENVISSFTETGNLVRHLRYGVEIADSLSTLNEFSKAHDVLAVANMSRHSSWIDALPKPLLRPSVIESLKAFSDISAEVRISESATNNRQKSAALNRAAGALNELAGYIEEKVLPPEKVLLKRVVQQWQSLVAEAQGQLGQAALRDMTPAMRGAMWREAGVVERHSTIWQQPTAPLGNPYVVGNPVIPPLFVGRVNVFNRIGEVWSAKAVPDSIIIYGHRRMGKSSILRNLNQAAPEGSVIVYADLAGETAFVATTADLLLGLADKIYAVVQRAFPQADFTRPDPETYATPAKAQFQFNRLTEQARAALNGRPLILALDEFEGVERAVSEGKIGPEIYQLLRTKSQEPGLTLVFGGLHTLDEMSREYQQPFFGSYTNILVSYLSRADAWHLITNPSPNFDLNYQAEAVERIITETGGQPYLVQQVCRDALDHLNHELFDEGQEREVKITLADVEAVLGPGLFQRGTVYFDGVWTQANLPEYRMLLQAMAKRDEPWSWAELESEIHLPSEALHNALHWAERHDILHKSESEPPVWGFYVPLMRRWVNERASA